jgi:type II secretory pathway pseudopilin PulG
MPTGNRRRERVARATGAEAGYNLVMLVMAITVLNIMIAAVLPLWSTLIRRDREQEAISRGLQYAEAIRVFQRRFGRLPNRLEELVEIEPRSIRRLWGDPLMDDGPWAVLVQLPQGQVVAFDPVTGLPIDPNGVPPGAIDPSLLPPNGAPGQTGSGTPPPVLGPIRGVKTRATGEAFQSFAGAESYSGWEFSVDLLIKAASRPSPAGLPRWNALNIGRPFRFGAPGEPTQPPLGGLGPGPGPYPAPGRPAPPGGPKPPTPPRGGRPAPGGGGG